MPFPTYDDYEELQKRGATPPFLPVAQAAPPPAPLAQPGPAPAAGLAPPPLSQPPEAPEPLDTPEQPGPITQRAMQMAQRGAPQLPNRGTAGLIADTAASIFLGPRKAQAILHPKYTQQMADYQRQLGGLAAASDLEQKSAKNAAGIAEAKARTNAATQQSDYYQTGKLGELIAKGFRIDNGAYANGKGSRMTVQHNGQPVQLYKPTTQEETEEKKRADQATWETITPEMEKSLNGLVKAGTKVPPNRFDAYLRIIDTKERNPKLSFFHETNERNGDYTLIAVDPTTGKEVSRTTYSGIGQKRERATTVNVPGAQSDDAKVIAEAIASGKQPPDLRGLYRMGSPVRAELARNGYDLTTAQRDWQAITRHIATLNGPQQERLHQAIKFTYDSLDVIEDLYARLSKAQPPTGFKLWNRAALGIAANVPGQTGALAQNLRGQINDLVSELATVYKGGNASTDESLRLAAENLKAEWNPETFSNAISLLRKNLQIRRNSIMSSEAVGVSPNSPYGTGAAIPAPPQSKAIDLSKFER